MSPHLTDEPCPDCGHNLMYYPEDWFDQTPAEWGCQNCEWGEWAHNFEGSTMPAIGGINLIAAERLRQIEEEGWAYEHDDQHTNEELASAAAFYCLPEKYGELLTFWQFDAPHKKEQHDRIRQLVIAGALVAAELDRLLRLTPAGEES